MKGKQPTASVSDAPYVPERQIEAGVDDSSRRRVRHVFRCFH